MAVRLDRDAVRARDNVRMSGLPFSVVQVTGGVRLVVRCTSYCWPGIPKSLIVAVPPETVIVLAMPVDGATVTVVPVAVPLPLPTV